MFVFFKILIRAFFSLILLILFSFETILTLMLLLCFAWNALKPLIHDQQVE
jgi:hypothetical protein